jgi:hypothetical protein
MVEEARRAGYQVSERLVTDWASLGLLEHPERQRGTQGKRGALYLWSDNQRDLFLALLHHRPSMNHVGALAAIPVSTWLLWGEPWVELPQIRRAISTWTGGHLRASSEEKATASARAVVNSLARPGSTRTQRMGLREELFWAGLEGEFHRDRVAPLITAVIDPTGAGTGFGPSQASGEEIADYYYFLTRATVGIDNLSDGQFTEARARYREYLLNYLRDWAFLRSSTEYGATFVEPTIELMVNTSCRDLLGFLGQLLAAAERGTELPPVILEHWTRPPDALLATVNQERPCTTQSSKPT